MTLQQPHKSGGIHHPDSCRLIRWLFSNAQWSGTSHSCGGNRRECTSDKNTHDLISLVLRLIRDLDDRHSGDPSGILRSCAGWIPLCRSIAAQERPDRYKRLARAPLVMLHGMETSAKMVHFSMLQPHLHAVHVTHNLVRSGSLCAAIHIDGLVC